MKCKECGQDGCLLIQETERARGSWPVRVFEGTGNFCFLVACVMFLKGAMKGMGALLCLVCLGDIPSDVLEMSLSQEGLILPALALSALLKTYSWLRRRQEVLYWVCPECCAKWRFEAKKGPEFQWKAFGPPLLDLPDMPEKPQKKTK